MDRQLGSLFLFAGNFAPRGSLRCDGSLISISSNPALYSLLGTNYGGDGVTTFGLPDLSGRAPVHVRTTEGEARDPVVPAAGEGATVPGSIAMIWCICTDGIFPDRS